MEPAEEARGARDAACAPGPAGSEGAGVEGHRGPAAWPLLLFLAFLAIDLAVYREALHGPFLSDDIGYIVTSPYTRDLTLESLVALFDPGGAASAYTANYAPVHLFFTAAERNMFAGDVLGYHLVNIAIHALNSVLLSALLWRSGLSAVGALLGGLVFAVHPANVEAVAWISQSKTNVSMALSLGALLALRRHPAVATLLFALALLTKASALFALPMAAAFAWVGGFMTGARSWRWLSGWVLLFGLYALPQFGFFQTMGAVEVPAYEDHWVQLRSIAAIGTRYLAMALTSWGVSAFQELDAAVPPFDPWWLAAPPLAACLAWRTVAAFRRRSNEAAYWVAAAAAFAPVSQIFPFHISIADRYLYFILPGLIGGALFWFVEVRDRLKLGAGFARAGCALAAALCVFFAFHSAARARLWSNETLLYLDTVRHYPNGAIAAFFEARRAAQQGDAAAAVAALRHAAEKGIDRFMALQADPGLAPIRETEEFQSLVHEMAGHWIERAGRRPNPTAPELRVMAHAHIVRGELAEAEALLERALALAGPLEDAVREELASLRARPAKPGGEPESQRLGEGDGHRAHDP